jgi:hypothetical protein
MGAGIHAVREPGCCPLFSSSAEPETPVNRRRGRPFVAVPLAVTARVRHPAVDLRGKVPEDEPDDTAPPFTV